MTYQDEFQQLLDMVKRPTDADARIRDLLSAAPMGVLRTVWERLWGFSAWTRRYVADLPNTHLHSDGLFPEYGPRQLTDPQFQTLMILHSIREVRGADLERQARRNAGEVA